MVLNSVSETASRENLQCCSPSMLTKCARTCLKGEKNKEKRREGTESVLGKMRRKVNKADILVGACYHWVGAHPIRMKRQMKYSLNTGRSLTIAGPFTECLLEIQHSRGQIGLQGWHEVLQGGIYEGPSPTKT